ncbi:spore wall protein 26, precursor [Vairimorpha apis BRL 01]|uniref:Spore wall protein 26 n=1 Tax=Vairimorpha apis BRL 01 TaxID=1037528 RepID=T0MMH7_9MICR|nr:hypothetical protein NAPIS_ORF00269 [Vairimorpha apis BRL 01]EQB62210.1 spore wall protein 26, precursor [Vairimorpha apis BRL 01]
MYILLFYIYVYCLKTAYELQKTTSGKLFDESTTLARPDTLGMDWKTNYFVSKTNYGPKYVAEIYSQLRLLLSHYFTYFYKHSAGFRSWYNDKAYEMDDKEKISIVDHLNANLRSIHDLDSFWQVTESPYLEARLVELDDNIIKLDKWITNEGMKFNFVHESLVHNSLNDDEQYDWLRRIATIVSDNLKAGLRNHQDGRYTHVFKNFLTATVEKKKLDAKLDDNIIMLGY